MCFRFFLLGISFYFEINPPPPHPTHMHDTEVFHCYQTLFLGVKHGFLTSGLQSHCWLVFWAVSLTSWAWNREMKAPSMLEWRLWVCSTRSSECTVSRLSDYSGKNKDYGLNKRKHLSIWHLIFDQRNSTYWHGNLKIFWSCLSSGCLVP